MCEFSHSNIITSVKDCIFASSSMTCLWSSALSVVCINSMVAPSCRKLWEDKMSFRLGMLVYLSQGGVIKPLLE